VRLKRGKARSPSLSRFGRCVANIGVELVEAGLRLLVELSDPAPQVGEQGVLRVEVFEKFAVDIGATVRAATRVSD
jgi:hypothetical protein